MNLASPFRAIGSDAGLTQVKIKEPYSLSSHYTTQAETPAQGNEYRPAAHVSGADRSEKCSTCGGAGWVPGTDVQPECCGNFTPHGVCHAHCAVPVEVETQEECPDCCGTGSSVSDTGGAPND